MSSLKIAVCDDDNDFLNSMESALDALSFDLNRPLDVHTFQDIQGLISDLEKNKAPDILFLDVEMPQLDGISLGHHIREKLGSNLYIVYVSYLPDYSLYAYQVQANDFIVKPPSKQRLKKIIETFLKQSPDMDLFEFVIKGLTYQVPLKDIIYFESSMRYIQLHGKNETYSFRGSISKLEKDLHDKGFVRPHQSFLINEKYVHQRKYDLLILSDETVIPISQNRRSQMRAHFLKHFNALS